MKLRITAGLAAGCTLSALFAAPALAGPTVTIRVEGAAQTLLERTQVTLPDAPPPVTGGCDADTVGAAIDVATAGQWDRHTFATTILGESHDFTNNNDYWAEWVNRGAGYRFGHGICNDHLNTGDDVAIVADHSDPTTFGTTVNPMIVEGVPAKVQRGTPLTVIVVDYRAPTGSSDEGTRTPVAGATITGGGVTATTGGDGRATLIFPTTGVATLKATKAGNAPSGRLFVTVTNEPVTAPPPDTTAPLAAIDGIRNGQRFSRRRAPRELHGTVSADPSGLWAVKVRLTRRLGKRCWYFSGTRERFLKRTCGKRYAFKVSDQPTWSYLLPARLPRGRYVLGTYAIDNAFNHGATETVRFRVR
jgi:hypothetical protein